MDDEDAAVVGGEGPFYRFFHHPTGVFFGLAVQVELDFDVQVRSQQQVELMPTRAFDQTFYPFADPLDFKTPAMLPPWRHRRTFVPAALPDHHRLRALFERTHPDLGHRAFELLFLVHAAMLCLRRPPQSPSGEKAESLRSARAKGRLFSPEFFPAGAAGSPGRSRSRVP